MWRFRHRHTSRRPVFGLFPIFGFSIYKLVCANKGGCYLRMCHLLCCEFYLPLQGRHVVFENLKRFNFSKVYDARTGQPPMFGERVKLVALFQAIYSQGTFTRSAVSPQITLAVLSSAVFDPSVFLAIAFTAPLLIYALPRIS
jgi:hypothetical protein